MKLKRVCALWHKLLNKPHTTEHIRVCVESLERQTTADNYNCFRMAVLLTRAVTAATRCFTITGSPDECQLFLVRLLKAMKVAQIHVPLIVLKDYILDGHYGSSNWENKFCLRHSMTMEATPFQGCCGRLALYNWKVSHLFGRAMNQVLVEEGLHKLQSLPLREKMLMRPLGWDHVLAVDHLEVTLPRVVLDYGKGEAGMMASRIMCAVNEHFPPVTDEMHAKVKAVYNRWVRQLVYPVEWERIRSYLSLFSGFHSDGTPRSWVDVDLTLGDTAELSKMALYGINEIFMADQ
ncbi:uncharacterized protein LOC129602128 [Paramacrobiotus metropolitanus]|uniref:uncharacterized protein LOC129602128 n=1 Tax=Paramacrobiotus metropolitanus TaxID=2943436 RepID=UPI002446510C|nr:uncharacterized protein LOC129602128 [Paramacrobiotus metropolitanus]